MLEYIGEKIFLQELEGEVWVAKGPHQNIYALELDETGFSLPVWSQEKRVVAYLENAMLTGGPYTPHAVPLNTFTNAWLSNQSMAINELLVNMDGLSTQALVLTVEEFTASQAKAGI